MSFNEMVRHVAEAGPQFNRYALTDFIGNAIDNSPEFIKTVFTEGFKLITNDDIELMGYTVVSPEDTVRFELISASGSKASEPRIPLTVSHMRLIRYRIRLGNEYIDREIYTPYMFENMLYIKGKRSIVRKVILEKTYSRLKDKDNDGLTVSPIRINMKFSRKKPFRISSYTSKFSCNHFIIAAKLFYGALPKRPCDLTLLHYMLAKFGFVETLTKFGLSKTEVCFTTDIGDDTNAYEYFSAIRTDVKGNEKPSLFLKVKKTILYDDQSTKFIVNLVYVLHFFHMQTIDNVYVSEGSVWKVLLGWMTFDDQSPLKCITNAETHLKSVDTVIDPVTRERFATFGLPIENVYDLLVTVFINIDSYMVNTLVQDLYQGRLDVDNGLLVERYGKLFLGSYALSNKPSIKIEDVKRAFRIKPMMFLKPSGIRSDDSKDYLAPPDIIGDNFLLSGGLSKIRLGAKADQRFHWSILVAESVGSFSGKIINKNGFVNPYIPIDRHGGIVRPDYADDVDVLGAYLPR